MSEEEPSPKYAQLESKSTVQETDIEIMKLMKRKIKTLQQKLRRNEKQIETFSDVVLNLRIKNMIILKELPTLWKKI